MVIKSRVGTFVEQKRRKLDPGCKDDPMAQRIQKELSSLPQWVEVLDSGSTNNSVPADFPTVWQLRLSLTGNDVQLKFPSGDDDDDDDDNRQIARYPFRAPELRIQYTHAGDTSAPIPLRLLVNDWKPASRVTDVLDEFVERVQASAAARAKIDAEVEQLRKKPPSWLVHLGRLCVPPWANEIDTAIAWNLKLDPVQDIVGAAPAARTCALFGPWRIEVIVLAPEGSAYDCPGISRGIRVELTMGVGFPNEAPRLEVLSIIKHLLGAFSMPALFYHNLSNARGNGERGIRTTLEHFRNYLAKPLEGLDKVGLPYRPDLKGDQILALWQRSASANLTRLNAQKAYAPSRLCQELFQVGPKPRGLQGWVASGLCPQLAEAIRDGTPERLRSMTTEVVRNVFVVDLLTELACDQLMAELDNYERVAKENGWHISRPNSMNNFGLILNDIGLEYWTDALLGDVLRPLSAALFPIEGAELVSHHTFMVAYEAGADLGLDMHTDDADVTFNLCLGKEFSGAGLTFCGQLGASDHRKLQYVYNHKKGRCLIHLGRQRHGADDITSGQRRNLIIWGTNRCYRQTQDYISRRPTNLAKWAEKEESPPDKVCVSRTHDRDASIILAAASAGSVLESREKQE